MTRALKCSSAVLVVAMALAACGGGGSNSTKRPRAPKGFNGAGAVEEADVKTGVIKEVKVGFNYPVAVKFDAKGRCNVLSTAPAVRQRLDLKTGVLTDVAKPLTPIVDNFAFDGHGRIFISSFTEPVLTVVAADGTTSMLNIGS